jgi:arsenite methyltransferase
MSDVDAPDYGLDAPGVVRNLLLGAVAGLLLFAGAAFGIWSAAITFGSVRLEFAGMGLTLGTGCLAMGFWMLWSSKVGKLGERERLLDRIAWTGSESVLDVGLMLVGAARRLTIGRATGIDIWQAEDLSDNHPEATLENARREGVADRVEIQTADMRKMPFPDAAFDVIVSKAAIHNLYAASDRAQAIAEIARVLKRGGRAVIDDIRHGREYAAAFSAAGCTKVESLGSPVAAFLLGLVTWGSMRPCSLRVTR